MKHSFRPALPLFLALPIFPLAAEEAPFIRDWLVCGPFENRDAASRLTRDDLFGEADVCPDKGAYSAGRPWVGFRQDGDSLDFRNRALAFDPPEKAVAYAHVYVQSPTEQDVDLLVGSDDGVAVWLNGESVLVRDVTRGWARDQDRVSVRLRKGWNRALFKVTQGGGAWEVGARFAGPDAGPVPGLVASAANPDPSAFATPQTAPRVHLLRAVARASGEEGKCDLVAEVANVGGRETGAFQLRFERDGAAVVLADVAGVPPGHPASVTFRCTAAQVAALVGSGAAMVAAGSGWPESREPLSLPDPEGLLRAVAESLKAADLVYALDNFPLARLLFPLDDRAHAARLEKAWDALRRNDLAAVAAEARAAAAGLQPYKAEARAYRAHLVGQCHIDLAWLWRWWPETIEVCAETYGRICRLMDKYPDFTYAQSSAQTYMWMEGLWGEKPAPEADRARKAVQGVFEALRAKVQSGRWAVVGGMMGEADGNLPSGESYVRQILYAKRYWKRAFGIDVRVGWQPDSFGFMWTLPQIFKKSGIDYFCTTKIGWNDTTRFPWNVFWWQAPDGSRVLACFPYGAVEPEEIVARLRDNERNAGVRVAMLNYGAGDHGGGPSEREIEQALRLGRADVFPKTTMSTPQAFFDDLVTNEPVDRLPVWDDELYLEYHRGTYTSQAQAKWNNRRAEALLGSAEAFASWAHVVDPQLAYPTETLRGAWMRVNFNQFHDVLPGSSIREVYLDAAKDYAEVSAQAGAALDRSLQSIASRVQTAGEGIPVLVFNPLAWERADLAEVAVPWTAKSAPRVVDAAAAKDVPSQVIGRDGGKATVLFYAPGVPSVGYKLFHVREGNGAPPAQGPLRAAEDAVEGPFFRVEIDRATGNVKRIYDKANGREVLAPGAQGNRLLAFHDVPREYDAWEIDKAYEKEMWPLDEAKSVRVVEQGPVRAVLRVEKEFLKNNKRKTPSRFTQDVVLYASLPRVDFRHAVDWNERHVLLKCAYPLAFENDFADFEIAYGHIRRRTKPVTLADRAKFEVSFHRWMDVAKETVTVERGRFLPLLMDDHFTDEPTPQRKTGDPSARTLMHLRSAGDVEVILAKAPRSGFRQMTCRGQTIDVAGQPTTEAGPSYGALALVGAGVGKDEVDQVGLLYADGTKQTHRVYFTDWASTKPRTNDVPVVESDFPLAAGGEEVTGTLWLQEVPVDSGKALKAIVFPSNPGIRIFAATLVRKSTGVRREPVYGVSFLSESKYGVNVKDGREVRMTCLRAPTWPDETADQGQVHRFTFGLYPHAGGWREAGTPRRGREFNVPFVTRVASPHPGTFPVAAPFLRIEPGNVILEAVKHEEDGPGCLLRFYETHGREAEATIRLPAVPKEVREANLIEQPIGDPIKADGAVVRVPVKPYEIKTLRVAF